MNKPRIFIEERVTLISVLVHHLSKWSDKTFGYDRHPSGCINHLKKEVEELLAAPFDRIEYADCMTLLLDAYRQAGGSPDDLIQACFEKLEINKNRTWGEPDENGVCLHTNPEIS